MKENGKYKTERNDCLIPSQTQDFEWLHWVLVITENLLKIAEHQNKIKILDSVKCFLDVSTGILLLVSGLN